MSNIQHLCLGRLVFKSIGYIENDSQYTYQVYSNMGDIYNINGTGGLIAKIKFDKKNKYNLSIQTYGKFRYHSLSEMSEGIELILKCLEL